MKSLFDTVSLECSKITTRKYSTSFSLGITFLHKKLRDPIYSIYGFVRFADEIVDSFDNYNKKYLLQKFKQDTYDAIDNRISLNPILNSFQHTLHHYNISTNLVDTFLESMEMDLEKKTYSKDKYDQYILGSAEVVGLMCLHVFTENDFKLYQELKPFSMKLGSAFQKINFLRDMKEDYRILGRTYFPDVELESFSPSVKQKIEQEIEQEFKDALVGIKKLPSSSRGGVYLAYVYYYSLLKKIKNTPANLVLNSRIRVSNFEKFRLMLFSMVQFKTNLL